MSESPHKVQWPAVIQFQGDDELLYLATAADWRRHLPQQHPSFDGQDRLIDSLGQVFHPMTDADGEVILRQADMTMDLATFTTLLRAHAVRLGGCCAGKVGCTDVAAGMRLIAEMEDD